MTDQTLNNFSHQVRQNNLQLLFPLSNEQRFQTISLRQYKTQISDTELADEMQEELSFVSHINDICGILKEEDIPRNKNLASYISNLQKIFSDFAKEGHCHDQYLSKISWPLDGLLTVIQSNNQLDGELLAHLQSLVLGKTGKDNSSEFTSEKVALYLNSMVRYTKELQVYNNIFHDFLQHEAEKSKGLRVITRTEQCLLNLTGTIQQSIDYSRSALTLLRNFKRKLAVAEKQVQFN
ncbi:MAG: hypothetical protein ABIR18_05040 [Chitinophagaceae bacterium]